MYGLLAGVVGIVIIIFSWDFMEYQFGRSFLSKGTHVAVELCINRNQSDLISEKLIKNLCAREESQEISTSQLSGRAGPKEESYGQLFSGSMTNNFEKTIITEVVIEVEHYAVDLEKLPDGKNRGDLSIPPVEENIYVIKDIWMEPGQVHSFEFFERDMSVIPDMSVYDNEAVEWSWFFRDATGVQVQTR